MNGIFPSFEFLKSAGGIFVGIGRQGIVGFAHFVSNFLCCRALFMSSFVSRFLFGFEDIKCAVIFFNGSAAAAELCTCRRVMGTEM